MPLEHMARLMQLSKGGMACSHPDDDKRPAILIKDKAHAGSCSQVILARWAGLRSSFYPEAGAGRSALWLAGSAGYQSCLGARLHFRLPSFVRPLLELVLSGSLSCCLIATALVRA